jgi:hypothetical protein
VYFMAVVVYDRIQQEATAVVDAAVTYAVAAASPVAVDALKNVFAGEG